MRKQAVALLALWALVSVARGEFTLSISDDGTNLTMRALGSYDVSALTPVSNPFAFLGANATVAPTVHSGLYGWETGSGVAYTLSFSGTLTGTGQAVPASSVTTNSPFFFATNYFGTPYLILASGAPTSGMVNETAVFNNVTVASLGMIPGQSVFANWEGDQATIQVVPEPATVALIIVGGCTVLFRFRRRR